MKLDRRLADYLLARIASGEYPVGMKIPSVRRLTAKFAMPRSTAYDQLAFLIRSGILKAHPGKGIFVARQDIFPTGRSAGKLAAFISPRVVGSTTSISYLALLEFQQQAMAHGFEVKLCLAHYTDLTPEDFARRTADCRGAALFQEYDAKWKAFDCRIPVVATLMRHSFGGRISLVNLDPEQAAELAAAYFQHYDIQTVEILANMPPIYVQRAHVFQELWSHGRKRCKLYRKFSEQPAPYRRDRGYFFTSDTLLYDIYLTPCLRNSGRRLDHDFVILGLDGKRDLNPDWPDFPTVAVDWREIGACMFAELARLLREPDAPRRNTTVCGRLKLNARQQAEWTPDHPGTARTHFHDGQNYDPNVSAVPERTSTGAGSDNSPAASSSPFRSPEKPEGLKT